MVFGYSEKWYNKDMENKTPIRSFKDLIVYQESYKGAIIVMQKVLPALPDSERYDLKDQLSRSVKAIPRLIAEGYAKRHQRMGFQKYLDDALAESNETIVGLEMCRDIFSLDKKLIDELVILYDKTSRQIYNLSLSWSQFKRRT